MYRVGMAIQQRLPKGPLLVSFLFLTFIAASAQEWTWKTEQVDIAGEFTSLALDKEGNLHVSYVNDGMVKYAFRPSGTSKWFTMPVDKGNSFTNITVDAENDPYICYTAFGLLKYAHWNGKSLKVEQIAPDSGQIMYSCAMAIGPDGIAHIIWYQVTTPEGEYYHLKHAELKDGAWLARTVDYSGETGKWNCLRIDSQGVVHITYSAHTQGEQKYAYWNGRDWSVSTVESRNFSRTGSLHPGYGNSLAFTADGRALISYMDESRLKLARREGTSWSIETVDSIANGSWLDYRSSLLLDHLGYPHIIYQDSGRVKHAYWDGKKWHIQVIVPPGSSPSRYPSVAIDKQDTLYVSYKDPYDGAVKVATGTRAGGP